MSPQTVVFFEKNRTQDLQSVTSFLQSHLKLYGFELVDMPIIEHADLFLTKAGDQVAEQLFTFEQHGRTLALRPEFTASAVHQFISQGHVDRIVRQQFSGPVFINSPAGQIQHHSVGAEIFGLPGAIIEADLINMAMQAIMQLGLNDWKLSVGHVDLTRQLLASFDLDSRTERFILLRRQYLLQNDGKERLLSELADYLPSSEEFIDGELSESGTQEVLDSLLDTSRSSKTMGGRTRFDITKRLIQKRKQSSQMKKVTSALDFLQQWMTIKHPIKDALAMIQPYIDQNPSARDRFNQWKMMLEVLENSENIIVQPDLVRTWDYYTDTVFEIRTPGGDLLVGGGRYDELPRLLGAKTPIPAVGLAFNIDTITQQFPNLQIPLEIISVASHADNPKASLAWVNSFRKHSIAAGFVQNGIGRQNVVTVQSDGTASYNDKNYYLSQIAEIIQDMKGN